ncbi:dCTP deaminase [Ignisphaera sp. 4213-co]|uniref:dCTP deaminase n=1 Tax=Ignisphaera cupida TaxID=3050454 RepID=A0ABD4Z7I0_9CREN|nr:dCTP deaminase [Ignisphaera sp. 4213-co]MDK6029291.1 dCTP deaminase [Ignisphaera sp. 4213-co]
MILSDFDLINYIKSERLKIIPFSDDIVRENGLDLRIGDEICVLSEINDVLDPYDPYVNITKFYRCFKADEFIFEPRKIYLATTVEYVKVPPELMAFVELRSTFARMGLSIPPTIIDGGFEGQITIEIHTSTFPIKIKKNTRFLHVVFSKVTTPIQKPYAGRYQGQKGVNLPKLPVQ